MNDGDDNISKLSGYKPKQVQSNRDAASTDPLPSSITYNQKRTLKSIRKVGNGRSHGQIAIFSFHFGRN